MRRSARKQVLPQPRCAAHTFYSTWRRKKSKFIAARIRAGKGVKGVIALIIIAAIAVNAERHLALDLLVPDSVGLGRSFWQDKLGQGHEQQGGDDAAANDRRSDLLEGNSARLERGQLVGMIEHSQRDHSGQQNADRPHLLDDKGNRKQKELGHQGHWLAFFKEVVNLFKKIDENVNGNEAEDKQQHVLGKLPEDVAAENVQGSMDG